MSGIVDKSNAMKKKNQRKDRWRQEQLISWDDHEESEEQDDVSNFVHHLREGRSHRR
jgi:hypothetical protein